MTWKQTAGRKPRTGDKLVLVQFRNGFEPTEPAPASKWRWDNTGSPADIVAVRLA